MLLAAARLSLVLHFHQQLRLSPIHRQVIQTRVGINFRTQTVISIASDSASNNSSTSKGGIVGGVVGGLVGLGALGKKTTTHVLSRE